mgnify:CR=1 FL=1
MTDLSSIWADLRREPHANGSVYRRVLPLHPHDIYFHREKPSERRRVHISVSGAAIGNPVVNHLSSAGIELTVQYKTPESASLTLLELTPDDSPQFDDLISDLLETLSTDPGDGAIGRMISRTQAWFRFFELTRGALGHSLAAGLFAELLVVRTLLTRGVPPSEAVASWVGPDRASQDFHFCGGALEIKSDRTTGPGKLIISSELQLDLTSVERLFVALFQLDQRTIGSGMGLSELAKECLHLIGSDTSTVLEFQSKLLASGLDVGSSEAPHRFTVREARFYEVTSEFPRLTPGGIPQAVSDVSYTIDCAAIAEYEVSEDAAFSLLGV